MDEIDDEYSVATNSNPVWQQGFNAGLLQADRVQAEYNRSRLRVAKALSSLGDEILEESRNGGCSVNVARIFNDGASLIRAILRGEK